MKIDKFLDWDIDWDLTDVLTDDLTDDLTDVKCNVVVYAIYMPERCCSASPLHVLHAACYLLPLCATALLHKCNCWCYVITG